MITSALRKRVISYTFTLLLIHQFYVFYNWLIYYSRYVGDETHTKPPLYKINNQILTKQKSTIPFSDFFRYNMDSRPNMYNNQKFDETNLYYPDGCTDKSCAIIRPTFVIGGAQKSGTTSLFYYLQRHPQIVGLSKKSTAVGGKEIRFFDKRKNYTGVFDDYIKNFPTVQELKDSGYDFSKRVITGESTPNYIRYPQAAERMSKLFPSMKIILLLRDPVDRAYSHYQHAVRIDGPDKHYTGGHLYKDFIERENDILKVCDNVRFDWQKFSDCYAGESGKAAAEMDIPMMKMGRLTWMFQSMFRGVYAGQLMNWGKHFPANQFLIIQSEDFYTNTKSVLQRVERFLDLDPYDWDNELKDKQVFNFGKRNRVYATGQSSNYEPVAEQTKRRLQNIFEKYNQELKQMIRDFPGWEYN